MSIYAWYLQGFEDGGGPGSHGTGVNDGCQPLCGYWDLNLVRYKKITAMGYLILSEKGSHWSSCRLN